MKPGSPFRSGCNDNRRMKIPEKLTRVISEMRNAPPSFQVVGTGRSLHLGFGKVRSRTVNGRVVSRGEWEIGSYCGLWKINFGGELAFDCNENISIENIANALPHFPWTTVRDVEMLSRLSVRFEFANGMTVDFGRWSDGNDDDDELCHIFYPPAMVAVYQPEKDWQFGPSDQPWTK